MPKTVVIDSCSHCPYYDDFYYGHEHRCTLLDKIIICGSPGLLQEFDIITNVYGTPPEECPLQDTNEKVLDLDKIMRK